MGQGHAEYRAGVRVLDPDAASVRFDDQLAEGQAQAPVAAPTRLRRRGLNEALEDALALIRRDAAASVDDPKHGRSARLRGFEPDGAALGGVPDGVVDQVLEHPAQEISIRADAGDVQVSD